MTSPYGHTHDLTTLRGRAELLVHRVVKPYRKLSKKSKTTIWILTGINVAMLIALIIITPKRIARWFHDLGMGIKDMGWKGTVLLMLCVVASSHPPLFGFSATMSLIGFSYGLWWGMFIGGLASLIGGALAWFSIRTFFHDWMRKFGSSNNKQWEAFGHVMREKGWPLVALIRWCPLPWNIGNGLFASMDGVEFWHFMLANVLFLPRLFIPVFIGSRLESMTGGDDDGSGEKKSDPLKFWLNLISIIISGCISVGTGLLIYRLTLAQMRKVDTGEPGEGDLAVAALEQTALLGDYSDEDEVVEEELVPRRQPQEEV